MAHEHVQDYWGKSILCIYTVKMKFEVPLFADTSSVNESSRQSVALLKNAAGHLKRGNNERIVIDVTRAKQTKMESANCAHCELSVENKTISYKMNYISWIYQRI